MNLVEQRDPKTVLTKIMFSSVGVFQQDIQNDKLVSIVRAFIRAGCTWLLHLQALKLMLPFLAATGHHNYTKSLVLYLNKMESLQDTHPDLYSKFVDGLFVLRRSENYWAGVYTDLYIEQVLMKNVKAVGGLAGRGLNSQQI